MSNLDPIAPSTAELRSALLAAIAAGDVHPDRLREISDRFAHLRRSDREAVVREIINSRPPQVAAG